MQVTDVPDYQGFTWERFYILSHIHKSLEIESLGPAYWLCLPLSPGSFQLFTARHNISLYPRLLIDASHPILVADVIMIWTLRQYELEQFFPAMGWGKRQNNLNTENGIYRGMLHYLNFQIINLGFCLNESSDSLMGFPTELHLFWADK